MWLKKDLQGECELQEHQNERNGEKIRPKALREDQISGRFFVSFCLFVCFVFCVDGLVVLNLFGACSSGRSIRKGEFHSLAIEMNHKNQQRVCRIFLFL